MSNWKNKSFVCESDDDESDVMVPDNEEILDMMFPDRDIEDEDIDYDGILGLD